jgi:hypothetical protein
LAGLGLASFFTRRNAEPIAPMIAAQPSPEMARAEGIWDWRFVLMMRDA